MWLAMLPTRCRVPVTQHRARARRAAAATGAPSDGQHAASEPRRVDGLPDAPGAPGSVMLRSSVPPTGAADVVINPRTGLPPPPPVSALAPDRRGISSASCSSSSGRKRWPPDPNPCPRPHALDGAEPHSPPSSPLPPAPAARRAPRARHHPRAATNTMPASNAATATPATASTRVSGAGLHAWAACGAPCKTRPNRQLQRSTQHARTHST